MPFFLLYVYALSMTKIPMYINKRFKAEESKTKTHYWFYYQPSLQNNTWPLLKWQEQTVILNKKNTVINCLKLPSTNVWQKNFLNPLTWIISMQSLSHLLIKPNEQIIFVHFSKLWSLHKTKEKQIFVLVQKD